MLLLFPVLVSAFLVADNFISYLLGEKWAPSVLYFQLLCIGGLVYPFTVINLNIIKVKGLANLYLRICILSKGLLIPAIFIGLLFGIKGLIIAVVAQRVIAAIINSYYSGKLVGYGLIEQLFEIRKPGIIIFIVFILFFALKPNITSFLRHDLLIMLIIPSLVFSIFFYWFFGVIEKPYC